MKKKNLPVPGKFSVVNPKTLNLDPDPGFSPNLDPDPDLDPGLGIQSILKEKIQNNREK